MTCMGKSIKTSEKWTTICILKEDRDRLAKLGKDNDRNQSNMLRFLIRKEESATKADTK